MEEVGLIKVLREGRKKRHYLAELGASLLKGSLNTITEAYILFLMEKLEDGCLNPEIKESTPERVTIRIDCPEKGKDCFITINLHDWEFQIVNDDEYETASESKEAESS
jgi:hypothetical protein